MNGESTAAIQWKAEGSTAVITIDRPAVRSAVDLPTALSLSEALDKLDADPKIRVGVLTGANGVFSAGMDLKASAASGQRPVCPSRGGFGIVGQPPSKPLIAAIEGSALGEGLEIAVACDVIVAAEDSKLGLPEVQRGLVASGGGLVRLPPQ
jgi:enoyl-CoA hydratase/carnithine racemase